MIRTGIITKGIASFYTVRTKDETVEECRLRGSFRKQNIKPAVGDYVDIQIEDSVRVITKIYPRKTLLRRPYVANASQVLLVCAVKEPDISYLFLDKMLILNKMNGLKTILCFNKYDLIDAQMRDEIYEDYKNCGADIVFISAKENIGIDELRDKLTGEITVVSGVSGAGKSTLINRICPNFSAETGDLSQKIKRGKHTTRHSELKEIETDSFILDTPGFSTLVLDKIKENEVADYYPEFYPYSTCRFNTCTHRKEPDCAVRNAVNANLISKRRYENYLMLYEEISNNKKY